MDEDREIDELLERVRLGDEPARQRLLGATANGSAA